MIIGVGYRIFYLQFLGIEREKNLLNRGPIMVILFPKLIGSRFKVQGSEVIVESSAAMFKLLWNC